MSSIDSYRRLFNLTGTTYVVVAFLARMPLAMSQLGILLLVSGETGSYGAGGFCAGALSIANAVGAPWWGARADRIGQRRVVAFQSLSGALALVVVLFVVHAGLPWWTAALFSALTGLLLPQIGPLARVRWRPITAGSGTAQARLVDVAFSYEGAADELSYVLGPALVGLGVSIANPTVALVIAAVGLGVFGTWFALHDTARTAHAATLGAEVDTSRLLTPALLVLCTAQLLIGTVFGSVQTGTTVLATAAGSPGATGYFHALLGVGSVVAGIGMASLPASFTLPNRLRWFSLSLLVLASPLLLVGSLPALVPVLLVLGCTIAPYVITTFTLGERVTHSSRTGAAMTILAAATGLGYAIGAAVAGRLADWGGHTPAFAVTVIAAGTALVVSWASQRVLRSAVLRSAAEVEGA